MVSRAFLETLTQLICLDAGILRDAHAPAWEGFPEPENIVIAAAKKRE